MNLKLTNISEPNENGLVTVKGTYIPEGHTCECKSKPFEFEMPQTNNLEYIKSTIVYLIKKG